MKIIIILEVIKENVCDILNVSNLIGVLKDRLDLEYNWRFFMKVESVHIQNLRSIKDLFVHFDDYTCFVGSNGAGKSNILLALNIFFREIEGVSYDLTNLEKEDFHRKKTDEPIIITVNFTDLGEEVQKELSDYCHNDKLIIFSKAIYDNKTEKAEVKQFGQKLGIEDFKPFFKAFKDGEKVSELKGIYEKIKEKFNDLPSPGTKDSMELALREYENNNKEECSTIPHEDYFYGWPKKDNKLEKYLQWIYVPAVKDVTTEQMEGKNTALGKLLARTVREKVNFSEEILSIKSDAQKQYQELLGKNQTALGEISERLNTRLLSWSHPNASLRLEWIQDAEKSIRIEEPFAQIIAGEGSFEGELSRFGHGFQRSYLLALLEELTGGSKEGSEMIIGIEEPELYQHPPQAKHLFQVFQKLSEDSQVMVCTHSPYFVSGDKFENVRVVRKPDNDSLVSHVTYQEISQDIAQATGKEPESPSGSMAKIHKILSPNLAEMFFAPVLVLVEGIEDISYIESYAALSGKWEEFRKHQCYIVQTNSKSEMVRPLAIANRLKIRTYIVFDADGDKEDKSGSRKKHEKDNNALLKLAGIENPDPFPSTNLWDRGVAMWHSDIGAVVREEIGESNWNDYSEKADRIYGHVGKLKKNPLHIAQCLAMAWDEGQKSESLERLCEEIINYAKL